MPANPMSPLRSRGPRRGLAPLALLAAACLLATPATGAPAGAAEGFGVSSARAREAIRRHVLRTLDGRDVSPSALAGEVVVINVWASWCSPCRRELPRLDALNAELSRKGGRVVAVSIDSERRNVERFASRLSLKLPIVHDGPDGLARELDLRHVPFTIVLGRDGEIAYTTSRSDDAGLSALAARARDLVAGRPVAGRLQEGESR